MISKLTKPLIIILAVSTLIVSLPYILGMCIEYGVDLGEWLAK